MADVSSIANTNLKVLGGTIDAMAVKNNVPIPAFRNFIESINPTFNPYAVNPDGTGGIAALSPNVIDKFGVDPFNTADALDLSAKLFKQSLSANARENINDSLSRYKDLALGGSGNKTELTEPAPTYSIDGVQEVTPQVLDYRKQEAAKDSWLTKNVINPLSEYLKSAGLNIGLVLFGVLIIVAIIFKFVKGK